MELDSLVYYRLTRNRFTRRDDLPKDESRLDQCRKNIYNEKWRLQTIDVLHVKL